MKNPMLEKRDLDKNVVRINFTIRGDLNHNVS